MSISTVFSTSIDAPDKAFTITGITVPKDAESATFLDAILPDLEAAYPFDTVKDGLITNTKTIKTLMEGYRAEIESKG